MYMVTYDSSYGRDNASFGYVEDALEFIKDGILSEGNYNHQLWTEVSLEISARVKGNT